MAGVRSCEWIRAFVVFLYVTRLVCSSVTRIRHQNAHHQRHLLNNNQNQIGRRSTASKSGGSTNHRQEEKKILDQILEPEVYDTRMRPTGVAISGSTVVNVNLYFRSFEKIDDVKMEYSIQITFRQQWNDHRLKFDSREGRIKYLTMTDSRKVWMPDTFFRNEKHGQFHRIIQPNLYIRVFPEGDILYSIRVSLTLNCPMVLELFPLDSQICSLQVASYGWTDADVKYMWKLPDPVQMADNLLLPGGFELANYTDDRCDIKTSTGLYSCLTVKLTFKRQLSYYILTIYIPTLMIVLVSWMSFWLDHKSAPARVALAVTTLLAMSTTTSSINNSLPPVAYTKAIDVWTNLCVSFVFLALLEYALVNYAARADAKANSLMMEFLKERPINLDLDPMFGNSHQMENGKLPYQQQLQQQSGYPNENYPNDGCYPNENYPNENYPNENYPNENYPNENYPNENYPNEKFYQPQDPLMRRVEGSVIVRHHREPKLLLSEVPRNRMGRLQMGSVKTSFKDPVNPTTTTLKEPVNPNSSQQLPKPQSEAKKIDVISRIVFPASFLGFNVMYWSYYLTRSS